MNMVIDDLINKMIDSVIINKIFKMIRKLMKFGEIRV